MQQGTYIDIQRTYLYHHCMGRIKWARKEPVLRLLGTIRAILQLSAKCNIQYRSVGSGLLHEARIRSMGKYPEGDSWCAQAWRHRQVQCKSSWNGIVRRTIADRKTVCGTCPSGLQQFSVPVFRNGRLVGMLLCSQLPSKSEGGSFIKQLRYVNDLPVPRHTWKYWYGKTASFPTQTMLDILEQCRIATEVALTFSGDSNRENLEIRSSAVAADNPAVAGNISSPDAESIVERAKRHLSLHLHERISLKRLALDIGGSPVTLTRRFKKETGTGIPAFLNELRMKEAATLLSSTVLSIREIFSSLGFSEARHFRRVFRNHTGLSPREFRQKKWTKDRIIRVSG